MRLKSEIQYEFDPIFKEENGVTEGDLKREQIVERYVGQHLAEWQEKGWVPDIWLLSHPRERKSLFTKFLNGWMSRAQESCRSRGNPSGLENALRRTAQWAQKGIFRLGVIEYFVLPIWNFAE
jgi:hypothetical protein